MKVKAEDRWQRKKNPSPPSVADNAHTLQTLSRTHAFVKLEAIECALVTDTGVYVDIMLKNNLYTIMKPRKQLIDAAVANGSIDRMNMLLSAAHLLNCEANSLVEEASDLMAENGLLLGDLKKLHSDFVRVADKYFKEFATLVTTDTAKMDLFSDLDGFDSAFREWAKVPNDWKPKEIEL